MTLLLCLLFFLSGVSALTFETLWFHQAGLALGNSVWASSLVLAGFMGGLGLGNGLAAWHGDRVGRPVRAYAALEVGDRRRRVWRWSTRSRRWPRGWRPWPARWRRSRGR